jgi:6-methylsalicylate decarboxylase
MNSQAQSPTRKNLIDVHHHIMPPAYVEAFAPRFFARNAANAAQATGWTPAGSIEVMDRNGVAVAITSISTAEFWFGNPELARRLSRDANELAAKMNQDYPRRFGFFATLPMPDIEPTLAEIAYAYDTLKADGVALMSNYGRVWPGDPIFAPIFDELNRRKARVFIHPILPQACVDMMPGVGESAFEYLFDTARAIGSLLYNGSLLRWPDIRFIFPHAGGALPPLADRVTRMADRDRKVTPKPPQGSMAEVKNLYFDVAASTNPVTLTGLLKLVPATHVMLGTDYPFLGAMPYTIEPLYKLGLSAEELRSIERETALKLFPRLAGILAV